MPYGREAGFRIEWQRPPSELANDYARLFERLERSIEDTALEVALEAEAYAKANHPWQNRTGEAERGLAAGVDRVGNQLVLSLAHGVDYGVWLEVRWAGRYAIILPTLQIYSHALMRRLDGLIDRARIY